MFHLDFGTSRLHNKLTPNLKNISLVLFLLIMSGQHTIAQWSDNTAVNNAICSAPGAQNDPAITTDGEGGAIIAWRDFRNGNADIYVQRINAAGYVLWATDGLPVCTATNNQEGPVITSDSAGGAIITWKDFRSGEADIYTQRVNAAGDVQWTNNGVPVCTAAEEQTYQTIVADGFGGAFLAWGDSRDGNRDEYCQRINAAGVPLWTANGVAVCTDPGQQEVPFILPDDAGGVVITWPDTRSGESDVYIQHLDEAGIAQWETNGRAICDTSGDQYLPIMTKDNAGGYIITWWDRRARSYFDLYAQRISIAGDIQWVRNGVPVSTAIGDQYIASIVSDNAGGAIISWQDSRNSVNDLELDIYSQHLDGSGNPLWERDGIPVCTVPKNQYLHKSVSDGNGGVIIAWIDWRNPAAAFGLFAQRITGAGSIEWAVNGVPVSLTSTGQQGIVLVPSDAGGAIVSWYNQREGNINIYAQLINANGTLGNNCQAPSIINQPLASQSVCPNTVPAPLSLTAAGEGLTYQWYSNNTNATTGGTLLAGASDSLYAPAATIADRYYYVVINGTCGTITSSAAAILVRQPPQVTIHSTNVMCKGNLTGAIDISVSGAEVPYSYQWTGNGVNSSALDQTGLGAGIYRVIVTGANGCADTATVTLTEPATILTASASAVAIPCGSATTTVTVSASGGTAPYAGTGSFTKAPGTYSFNVTDANGCTTFATITIANPGPVVNAGADRNLCSGAVTLTATAGNIITSGPALPVIFSELAGSTPDRRLYSGNIDYTITGNTFSQGEGPANCGKNAASSKMLTIPAGAVVKKAYLYWSGSGTADNAVSLNGSNITAENVKTFSKLLIYNYFAARADVTSQVTSSGNYTVTNLNWDNSLLYCVDNSAYGGWAMLVVYEQPSLPAVRLHINTEKFQYATGALATYSTTINNIAVPSGCASNAKFSMVVFEGDNAKSERLTIGGQDFGDNNFRGQSGPNLDILSWNIPALVTASTSSLNYSVFIYPSLNLLDLSAEGLFDYVKVLKYNTCPPACNSVSYRWTNFAGTTIGSSQSISISQGGTYIVKVTDCSGCTGTDTVKVNACSGQRTMTDEITKSGAPGETIDALHATVMPNPVASIFKISIKSDDKSTLVQLKVFDATGRLVYVAPNNKPMGTISISSAKWQAGIYYAQIIQGSRNKVLKIAKVN